MSILPGLAFVTGEFDVTVPPTVRPPEIFVSPPTSRAAPGFPTLIPTLPLFVLKMEFPGPAAQKPY